MSKSSTATVSVWLWMPVHDHRIVAQPPAQMTIQRLRPTASDRSQALGSSARIRPVAASVSRSMVRGAFLATRREFPAGRAGSLAVNSPTSLRSLLGRLRIRPVKSFALEVKGVQPSLQPPTVPGLGIHRGEVFLALPRHFKASLPERGDDIEAVFHRAVLDALEQVVPNQVARRGFEPESGPQLGRLDVGAVSGLLHPGPQRIVRTAPAVFVIEGVPERIECPPPAGRGNVEASPGLKVASCGKNMDVGAAALLAVEHRRPSVAVGVEPGPGCLLEGVQNLADLFIGRLVLRRPCDHAGGVPVLELQRVGDCGHHVWVAAQDFDALARLAGRVLLPEEVFGRGARRPGPVREKLNVHRDPGSRSGPAP